MDPLEHDLARVDFDPTRKTRTPKKRTQPTQKMIAMNLLMCFTDFQTPCVFISSLYEGGAMCASKARWCDQSIRIRHLILVSWWKNDAASAARKDMWMRDLAVAKLR